MDLPAIYYRHESGKKRQYGQRMKEVEHGVFTPLVFFATGGMVFNILQAFRRHDFHQAGQTLSPCS